MAIVAKTCSKYGINTYICIYLFHVRPYFNVKLTMKNSGHVCAYLSTTISSNCHKCLASKPKSNFTLYK